MWRLALSTIRSHRVSFAGTFVVTALAAALLSGVGVLADSGLRGGVAPDRYAGADVVLTTDATRPTTDALDGDLLSSVRSVDGVRSAAADVTFALTAPTGSPLTGHTVAALGALGTPLASGSVPTRTGQVVLDTGAGHRVGDRVVLRHGGLPQIYDVVGTLARDATANRPPAAYLLDRDVLALWPRAARSAVLVVTADAGVDARELAERLTTSVPGTQALTGRARGSAEFPHTSDAGMTLTALTGSVAGVTLGIVLIVLSSTMSLVVQQRRRGFALMRAVGATPRQLRRMLLQELLLVSAVAAPLGALPGAWGATLLRPLLVSGGIIPSDFELVASPVPVLVAVALVVPTGLLAALTGARKHLSIAPTEALRQASVESASIGRGRRLTAVVCAGIGLVAALSPWVVPGALGGASAGASALLLVTAAALAGPLLVRSTFTGVADRLGRAGGPSLQLALANTRGFSRRLTAVVVPLVLVVTFGAVQDLVGTTLGSATTTELDAGLRSDVIVSSEAGIHPQLVSRLSRLPGVRTAAPTSTTTADLKTDQDDELAFLDALSWESVPVRVVPGTDATDLLDLGVREGSLAALERPDTIAVSREAATEYQLSVGSSIPLRGPGRAEHPVTVVAVYDRGLGFGNLVVGATAHAAHAPDELVDTVLLDVEPGQGAAVAQQVRDLGLVVTDRADFIAAAGRAQAQSQSLSLAILLVLLGFIALGALNSLVMTTLGRRDEFALLQVVGTSRAQVLRTGVVEALVVGVASVALAVLTVLPAVLGVTYGFAHATVPTLTWPLIGALLLTAVLAPLFGIPLVAAAMTRSASPRRLA